MSQILQSQNSDSAFTSVGLVKTADGLFWTRQVSRNTRGPQLPARFNIDLELRDGALYIRPRAAPREATS